MLGMRVGPGTVLRPMRVTWPHQLRIGHDCTLEQHLQFKFDGIWQPGPNIMIGDRVFVGAACEFNIQRGIMVGDDTLIGSGSRFIDHDHGVSMGPLMRTQECPGEKIVVGSDVWIGCNAVILKGVTIGNGAIVGAGAVINKSVGAYEIWAGVPGRAIGKRG